jgi:hypothetical protein
MQLQQVGLLFGNAAGAPSTGSTPISQDAASNATLEALEGASGAGVASQSTLTSELSSLAGETGSIASNSQSQVLEALFGSAATADPLVNTLGAL